MFSKLPVSLLINMSKSDLIWVFFGWDVKLKKKTFNRLLYLRWKIRTARWLPEVIWLQQSVQKWLWQDSSFIQQTKLQNSSELWADISQKSNSTTYNLSQQWGSYTARLTVLFWASLPVVQRTTIPVPWGRQEFQQSDACLCYKRVFQGCFKNHQGGGNAPLQSVTFTCAWQGSKLLRNPT